MESSRCMERTIPARSETTRMLLRASREKFPATHRAGPSA